MSFIYNTISSWWNSFWQSLGLDGVFRSGRHKGGKLLLLGLDNAGKTTLLHRLATGGEIRPYPPTDRPRIDSFQHQGVTFQAWDLGGHEAVRHLWEDYVAADITAILFLVDAVDKERFEEAGYELDAILGIGRDDAGAATSNGNTNHRQLGQPHPTNASKLALGSADGEADGASTTEDGDDVVHDIADDDGSPLSRVPVAILLNKCDVVDGAAPTEEIMAKIDYEHLCALHSPHLLQVFRISVLTGDGYPDAFKWIASFL